MLQYNFLHVQQFYVRTFLEMSVMQLSVTCLDLYRAESRYQLGARVHWCQLNVKSAVRNRTPVASSRETRPRRWLVYTNKTHLRGFQNLNFPLVCGGGLSLCSREFHPLGLKLTDLISRRLTKAPDKTRA
ncbi:hypothetical protein Cal7507_4278 [Calothrix sp. PCC 7507]|nr:hypothetical protein Cal7507_4278 [Calothrix sp. PCC 7507]